MNLAVFTICSNAQLAQASVLLASVQRHLPAARRVLVLADETVDGLPYPAGCEIVPAHALGIPDFRNLAFRYAPHEFRAALKPFACQFLLGEHTHCLFLAPDAELFGPLAPVVAALDRQASFVLVPHLLAPAETADGPDDVTFLRDGTYDLGFLGVSGVPEAHRLLAWWARWLRWDCVDDRPTGFFIDQKFMDLMPGFAAGLAILRDLALNAAPWNLAGRGFSADAPDAPQVDGRPVGFFRFGDSYPAPDRPDAALAGFLAGYAGRVRTAGGDAIPAGCYAYGHFASGVPIPAIVRRMFHDDNRAWAGDPFGNYEAWSHLPARNAAVAIGSAVPSLAMQWLQARNPALTRMYPSHPAGAAALLRWWLEHGGSAGIDPRFLQPQALAAGRRPVRLRSACPAPQPGRADASVVAAFARPGVVRQAAFANLASLAEACRTVERVDLDATGPATGRLVLVCAEPHRLPDVLRALDGRSPQSCYRVFVPASEVVELSPDFRTALDGVDEIWAPTRHLQAALVLQAGIPVLHMPLAWDFAAAPESPPEAPYVLAEPDGRDALLACLDAFRTAFRDWPAATRPRLAVPRPEGDGELADAVARTEGATTVPATARLAAHAACVLALHRGEALGSSVARAFAHGVPVIGTDRGGCTDLLTPETGYPVDPGDVAGAAWSLRQVFRDPAEAKRRAARGRRRFEAECGRPAVAARQLARLDALGLCRAAAEPVHA